MKAAVALLAVGAAAQSTPVCFPPKHQLIRLAWNSQNDAYEQGRVNADYTNQQFRITEGIEQNEGPRESRSYSDVLFFPTKGTMYEVTGASWRDNSTWRCQTRTIPTEPVRDPCFTPNGTQTPTNRIGSQTLVDNFYFTRQQNGNTQVNYHIQLTPGGVPYSQSSWNQFGHEVEAYLDVNTTLPADAFAVPSICSHANSRQMSASELRAHPVVGRLFGAVNAKPITTKKTVQPVQGFQQSICVPPVNAVARRAWHDDRSSFDTTIEYLDVPHKMARFTDQIFVSPRPNQPEVEYMDLILDANANKMYRITQQGRDVNSRRCTVSTGIVSIRDPCFTTNGTYQRTAVLAGSLTVDVFFANNTDRSGIEHYVTILMTQQGIPVQAHHHTPAQPPPQPTPSDHWVELFEDFNTTLPANAFAIPAICNQAGAFDVAELNAHSTFMRNVLTVAQFN